MRVVVCVKRVAVLGDEVEFTPDGRAVDPDYLDYALNEWDSYALEEALRLRESSGDGEVLVVTLGDEESEEALVRCLAMGADRAVRVWDGSPPLADPISVARGLAEAIAPEQPDLVLCGAQSSDAVQGATGAALAGVLGWPCVAVARRIEHDSAAGKALVDRELEGGLIDLTEVELPAVVTVQTGINQPRYVTLRAMQAAAEQEIAVVEIASRVPRARVRTLALPPTKRADLLEGSPKEIAERIAAIVREVAAQ